MPLSPEATARKSLKRKQKRHAAKAVKRLQLKKSDWPCYKIAARNMLPRLPQMSKTELRDMLAQAARNTAGAVDA